MIDYSIRENAFPWLHYIATSGSLSLTASPHVIDKNTGSIYPLNYFYDKAKVSFLLLFKNKDIVSLENPNEFVFNGQNYKNTINGKQITNKEYELLKTSYANFLNMRDLFFERVYPYLRTLKTDNKSNAETLKDYISWFRNKYKNDSSVLRDYLKYLDSAKKDSSAGNPNDNTPNDIKQIKATHKDYMQLITEQMKAAFFSYYFNVLSRAKKDSGGIAEVFKNLFYANYDPLIAQTRAKMSPDDYMNFSALVRTLKQLKDAGEDANIQDYIDLFVSYWQSNFSDQKPDPEQPKKITYADHLKGKSKFAKIVFYATHPKIKPTTIYK